jgi:DNA mismatch repair ATPase MutS
MKAHLMYRDRDFDLGQEARPYEEALVADLELPTLFAAMSRGDTWLTEVVRKALLASSVEVDTILYRQDILKDCLRNEAAVREMYDLAVETIASVRKYYLGRLARYPGWVLHRSVEGMEMLVDMLRRLRGLADQHAAAFESEGFRALFAMLRGELGDDYFATVRHHLKQLKVHDRVFISAQLGEGTKGASYTLRREKAREGGWLTRIFATGPPAYSFQLPDRDEGGSRALSELRDRGINLVANALAQSTEHIVSFFNMLRTELAFYVGCLNLHGRLLVQGEPLCFPRPSVPAERRHSATGLYDVCLALKLGSRVIGNELQADDKDLVIVTGANQGGKSTFLRSIGLSQLMMQCGMFAPAQTFAANVCERIFTHYRREEDVAMKSGKFDEELSRMSSIIDGLVPNSLVLLNESFAATNEREGSEIARQVVTALIERHIKVVCVTHQYEFARRLYAEDVPGRLFLRAGRLPDGTRTFIVTQGQPLETSYGEDLYRQIFADDDGAHRSSGSLTTRGAASK